MKRNIGRRELGVLIVGVIAGTLGLTATLRAEDPAKGAIFIKEVTPAEAHAGQTLIARGENLYADRVKELYVTDATNDYRVEILEQTRDMIRFRLPADVPLGKLRLALVSDDLMMLQQPVFVRIVKAGPPSGA